MIDLACQQFLSRLRLLALGDVTGDLRHANELPILVFDRETLSEISTGLPSLRTRTVSKCLTLFAAADARENFRILVVTIHGDEHEDGFADCFARRITEEPPRAGIPACDDAIEVFAQDRIVRGLDDGCKSLGQRFVDRSAFRVRGFCRAGRRIIR